MKLLVCFDGSEQSHKAVKAAKDLALTDEKKEITLLHVYPEKEDSYWKAVEENRPRPSKELSGHERLQIEKFMNIKKMAGEVKEDLEKANIRVNKKIIKGEPVEKITEIAEKEGYDLIIIGNRGLGGLKKFMLGSVSNGVIQEAKGNVLVVK
ncbi:universal stress protein [Isachenkonia alkalipeptolytica]|uniref:Universal stress protein n=1 Tax=Isachenkonia alkalipeptolytica TaxID=2565777 RepID=A0AA44BE64_9CLOT|nr:universal stress protein [Isachenkonia alkalipeptolytica]NBG88603.1 universal stress protein [Isachenkonia alkalipeptolytica]